MYINSLFTLIFLVIIIIIIDTYKQSNGYNKNMILIFLTQFLNFALVQHEHS